MKRGMISIMQVQQDILALFCLSLLQFLLVASLLKWQREHLAVPVSIYFHRDACRFPVLDTHCSSLAV
jgi:hypothetical protein